SKITRDHPMEFQWVAGILALCSLITLLIALFLLLRRDWLVGWLKGMIGILALVAAAVMGLTALNLNGYRMLNQEITVATISFDKVDKQLYKANVVLEGSS